MESITDENGVVTEHLSYDAHGKRRLTDWQAGTPAIPGETPRGFTGHEHLDGVGLIHMNGRVYDPTLGRFLSADPNVQAPDDTQSFNRYTYVKNNPLSYTDPSGFFFKKLFDKIADVAKKVFKGFVSLAKKALKNEVVQLLGPNLFGGVGAAAFSGLTTLANGGSLSEALKAATITFVTTALTAAVNFIPGLQGVGIALQIAIKSVAHGVIGGVSAIARGGQFAGGFLSGAFAGAVGAGFGSAGLQGVPAIAGAAVAGGIGAELGGGKFKNGAISGAFSALVATVASAATASSRREGMLNGGGGSDFLAGGGGEDDLTSNTLGANVPSESGITFIDAGNKAFVLNPDSGDWFALESGRAVSLGDEMVMFAGGVAGAGRMLVGSTLARSAVYQRFKNGYGVKLGRLEMWYELPSVQGRTIFNYSLQNGRRIALQYGKTWGGSLKPWYKRVYLKLPGRTNNHWPWGTK